MSDLERIKRVIEVGQLQWFSATDVKFLLNEVERYKAALEKIANWGDDRPDCYPLYNIAEEALKEE